MECNVIKNSVGFCKSAFEGFSEEKMDFDIIIPDYCTSAVKILKCDVIPTVTSKLIESDRLVIEGNCSVSVIYVGESDGLIHSITESAVFSQSHPIKEQLDDYKIRLKLRAYSINCKLHNSRRISVKSIIGIAMKVMGNNNIELITDFEDCNIMSKFQKFNCCRYITNRESDIRISGEIAADYPITDIIKCVSNVYINDVKPIKDRCIIKGEAKIDCLYTHGEQITDIKITTAIIPFSEIIEIENADENSICDVVCDIISLRCDIGNNQEGNIINVEIEAHTDCSLYNNCEVVFLKDAYSKNRELTLKSENIVVEELAKIMKFTKKIKDGFDIEIENAVIDELSSKVIIKNLTSFDGEITVEGELFVYVVSHNDKEYKFQERSIPFKISEQLDMEFSSLRCEAEAICTEIDYSMPTTEHINIECPIDFNILLFKKDNMSFLSEVEINGDKTNNSNSKVVLYYADKGEQLWDIAKKYSSSVEIIKRDNNLDNEEVINNCMLIISNN